MAKKKWSELSAGQKRFVYVVGAAEAIVTTIALRDLARRPADDIRGPKAVWVMVSFVQPVGPLAYLVVGRR